MINEAINKLINKENLTFSEAKEAYDEIFSGLSTIVQSSSFVTALEAKKPTLEEKSAGILSAKDSVKKINLEVIKETKIENIILNEDIKYIDFGLMNDLICASNNLNSLRYCFKSHLNSSRSFDILNEMGVRFKEVDFDFSKELERVNLAYIYLSTNEPFFKYTYELKQNLEFSNILALFEKMLNPYNSKNLFLGVNSCDLVEQYAQLALNLNFSNSIVVCGFDNTPFVSIENETHVAEAWKNKIFTYKISAELFNFKRASLNEIKVENNKHCADLFLDVMENKAKDELLNAIALNAGLCLYISKIAPSLFDGIELALKTIKEGKLKEKFAQIKKFYEL